MTTTQPVFTNCQNCGTADHAGYSCPCGCHKAPERQAEWGHWGITFFARVPGAYAPTSIAGTLYFPVGTRGPCDMDGRERYIAAIAAWRERGTLPTGIDTRHAVESVA
jgi:hypothetical protein